MYCNIFLTYQCIPLIQNGKKSGLLTECHACKAQWSTAYFVIKLDGKTIMFIMQWHGCAAYKNTLHTSITKVKTHHNTPNSQENLEKAEYVIIIEFCQKINK